jgi:hypothetical protein
MRMGAGEVLRGFSAADAPGDELLVAASRVADPTTVAHLEGTLAAPHRAL